MWQSILAESNSTFWLPERASTYAPGADALFNWIMWISIFFFLLVTVLLLAFVIKYRHRPGIKRDTSAGHSTALEITWTLIPTIIVVFLYYYGFKQYMRLAVEPPNAYPITVNAKMWQWTFTYPNGYEDAELHMPVNVPVRASLQSSDVIHSFSVPEFRTKKDVVPGRYNRIWFQATESDGTSYVMPIARAGQPSVIGIDANGMPLTQVQQRFGGLPDDEQAALKARLAGGAAVVAATVFPTVSLHDGRYIFATAPGTDGLVMTNAADKPRQTVPFSSIPASVQDGLRSLAGGEAINANQPVEIFDDARAFEVYCAAYCGTNHSIMHSHVVVHRTQADFERWLKQAVVRNDTGTPVEKGKKLYASQGCAQCHSIDGTRVTGPSWKDLYGSTQHFTDGTQAVVDRAFLLAFIRNPSARVPVGYSPVMPPFPLSDAQITNIGEYMKTISQYAPKGEPTSGPATQPAATAPSTVTPADTKLK